jgi:hypothetical protein
MEIQEKVTKLIENYGANDQRTEAWHLKRGEMLTASEIYKALPDATEAQKHEIIMSKLVPRPKTVGPGPKACAWGTRFEPIAKKIYCLNQGNIEIVDTTCIPHPVYPFLGASPDGIIITPDPQDFRYGKLVEFKCPFSRKFDETTPVPNEYYHQMHLQMECTQIDECEYIEMAFKELNYSDWVDCADEFKSFFAISEDGMEVRYRELDDTRDVAKWRAEAIPDGEWDILYWTLKNWRAKTVEKDPTWMTRNIDSFRSIWEKVQEYRNTGTLPENPKDKKTLTI